MTCLLTLCGPIFPRRDPEDYQWWPSCSCSWNCDQGRTAGTLYFNTEEEAIESFRNHEIEKNSHVIG